MALGHRLVAITKIKAGFTQHLRLPGTTCKTSQTGTLLILTISNSITLSTWLIQKQRENKQFTLVPDPQLKPIKLPPEYPGYPSSVTPLLRLGKESCWVAGGTEGGKRNAKNN